MAAPVVYTFQGSGAGSVISAFDSIDARAKKSAANATKGKTRSAKASKRAGAKKNADATREAQKRVKIAEREAKALARIEAKAATASERRSRKLHRNRARNRLKQMRARKREAVQTERLAKRQAAVQERAARKASSARARAAGQRRDRRGSMLRSAAGFIGGAGVAALGAGAAFAGAATRQGMQLEDQARSLSVQGRDAGGKAVDPAQIAREASATAIKVGGIAAQDVIGAMSAFVTKTGKFELARDMSETFATVARATGADVTDIAMAGADLFQKFDIKTIDQMKEAMAALTNQGKAGAFELSDAASQFPKIAASAQRLGLGTGVGALRTVGGLSQIARESTGSSEQAGTAISAMFRQLTAKSGVLEKKHGVQVFGKDGNANDIVDVLTDTIGKVGGSDMKEKRVGLQKVFGDQGVKALSPLMATFAKTMKDTNGNAEAASAAVRDKLLTSINAAGTWGDVVEDAAIENESQAAKMTTAWAEVVAAAQGTLVPAITDVGNTIASALDAGGMDLIMSAFDVAAENVRFFGDVIGAVADSLKELGLIKADPTKEAAKARAAETRFGERADAKIAAKQSILGRFRQGRGTEADTKRLAKLDTEISGLLGKRDAAGKKAGGLEAERDKPLNNMVGGTGTSTDQKFFTSETFQQAMIDAAQTDTFVGSDESNARKGRQVINQLEEGRGTQNLSLNDAQQQIVSELAGQIKNLQGPGADESAPAEAIGKVSAAMGPLAEAAGAAAIALKSVKASERADVGGT